MKRLWLAPALAVVLAWALLIYLVPLAVGLAVGAVPVRVISSGIFFDQTQTSLLGYRLILWGPVIVGSLCMVAGLVMAPSRFVLALGLVGATFAATLLVLGGGFGIGPAGTLLIGTDLRWIWRTCVVGAGLVLGLAGAVLLRTRAEDHAVDFPTLRREILLTGVGAGVLILLLAPGPFLGKVIAGFGSWLGGLVWLVAL